MGLALLGLLSEPDPGEQTWVWGRPTDNQWVELGVWIRPMGDGAYRGLKPDDPGQRP